MSKINIKMTSEKGMFYIPLKGEGAIPLSHFKKNTTIYNTYPNNYRKRYGPGCT